MSANYRNPNFLLPNELNQSINPDLSVDRHSLYSTEFDGSNYVDIAGGSIDLGVESTISMWVNLTGTYNYALLGEASYSNTYLLYIDSSKIYFRVGGSYLDWSNSSDITSGNWHHILITRNSSNVGELFIDGNSKGTDSTWQGGDPGTTSTKFDRIGARYSTLSGVNGKIDEVAAWSTILDNNQRQALADSKNSPVNIMALDPKPIAYYPLGEEARNTGYLSSGSDVSGSEWQFPNQVVQSTVFDFNAQDYIQYPHISLPGAFTVSTWVKTTDTDQYGNLFSSSNQFGGDPSGGSNTNNNWQLIRHNQATRFIVRNSSNTSLFDINTTNQSGRPDLSDGNWHHILAIWDGTTNINGAKIFFDGVLRALGTSNGLTPRNDSSIPIRAGGSLSDKDFIGEQSNQQVWNTALTYGGASADGDVAGGDVAAIYNNGSPYSGTQPQLSNLKAWYKLNAANSSYAPHSANFNSALSFDGSNSYIDTPSINLGKENTISFWAKRDGANFNGMVFGGPSASNSYTVFLNNVNRISYGLDTTANTFINADITSTLAADKWFHCVLVRDEADLLCYINGFLKETLTGISGSGNDTIVETIGDWNKAVSGFKIEGNLSNIAVFNTALDAPAVSTLYNNGTPEASISHSPVSWWKLDAGGTTITDYGSGGNNGTNNGATLVSSLVAVEQWVFTDSAGSNNGTSTTLPSSALVRSDLQFESPYSNFSLYFNGTNNKVNIPDPGSFTSATSFSISFWDKPNSFPSGGGHVVFDTSNSGFTESVRILYYSGNTLCFRIVTGGATSQGTLSTTQTGVWNHYVMVFDGSLTGNDRLKAYQNGSLLSLTYSGSFPASVNISEQIGIGNFTTTYSNKYNGKIDELAIWNSALNQSQVSSIYNNGLASDLTSLSPSNWWRLGEDAYFVNNVVTIPNQIAGGPSGTGSGTQTSMLVADAPGSYGSGSGVNLDIVDRVGEAPGTSPINVGNSQSYNMIPDDRHSYVPGYAPATVDNDFSMDFDGANDYIDLGSSNFGITATTAFSISAWINSTISGTKDILSKREAGGGYTGFTFRLNQSSSKAGKVKIILHGTGGGQATATTNTDLDPNIWYNVILTSDGTGSGSGLKIYINGVDDTTGQSGTVTDISNSINTMIGSSAGLVSFFSGKIDEVAIFDYALTPKQIREDIFNASKQVGGVNKTADLNNNSNLTAPVAWYRMGD